MVFFLPVLFEDNHLLILNKPAGLLTQPSGTTQDSLEEQAKTWIKEVHQKPGNVFLHAVHRLDKSVSGVTVFAKTSKSLSRLNEDMRAKKLKKIYWAWIEGELERSEGQLEHWLVHDDYCAKVATSSHPQAKLSRLNYRVLERQSLRTLVEVELDTGRYHQIRAQFAAIAHPIWGDLKYGSQHPYFLDAIALHHQHFEMHHPITKLPLIIEAPIPLPFSDLFAIKI